MERRYVELAALGKSIRHHREQLGVSQETFARSCWINRTYMGRVERGEQNLSFSNLVQITEGLGATLTSVMRRLEHELELATPLAEHNKSARASAPRREKYR